MTSAQGQEMTRKLMALLTQALQSPKNSGGMTASASAAHTTLGV